MTCEPRPPVLQPAAFRVTPSKPMSPWIGSWAEGARYSNAQLYEMAVRGMNPETAEAVRVYRPASSDETWWGTNTDAPVHEYDCPVLGRRADGRIKILAPAGIAKLVLADGWTHHPKKVRGWGRGLAR